MGEWTGQRRGSSKPTACPVVIKVKPELEDDLRRDGVPI
jgi:hypothetical protein